MRPLPVGKLYSVETNTSSASQDQQALPGLQIPVVKEALPGRCRADGNCSYPRQHMHLISYSKNSNKSSQPPEHGSYECISARNLLDNETKLVIL